VHGKDLVEAAIGIRQALAVAERQLHATGKQRARVPFSRDAKHHFGMVNAGHKSIGDAGHGGGQRSPMPEADFQHAVAWLQVEEVESDSVRRGGLVRHDATDDLAQKAHRSTALPSNELRAAHSPTSKPTRPFGPTRRADAQPVGQARARNRDCEADCQLIQASDAASRND
jgi:hypothetical protein